MAGGRFLKRPYNSVAGYKLGPLPEGAVSEADWGSFLKPLPPSSAYAESTSLGEGGFLLPIDTAFPASFIRPLRGHLLSQEKAMKKGTFLRRCLDYCSLPY